MFENTMHKYGVYVHKKENILLYYFYIMMILVSKYGLMESLNNADDYTIFYKIYGNLAPWLSLLITNK